MKKISTLFIIAIMAVLPNSAMAQAWADPVVVAGHIVQGEHAIVSVTGSGIEGSITYDYNKKELVLDNATITFEGDGVYGIANGVDGLKLIVKGYCTVNVTGGADTNLSNCGIYSESNLSIQIDPESYLSIDSNGWGILALDKTDLNITGGQYSYLSIDSNVMGLVAMGTFSADCLVIAGGDMGGYFGPDPVNENYGEQLGIAEFDEASKTFVGEDGKAASLVYLGSKLGLYISGEQMTDFGLLIIHLLGDEELSYDKDTKTLTINKEEISYDEADKDKYKETPVIENRSIDGLTIQFTAADVKMEHDNSIFRIRANTTIEGDYNYLNVKANGEAECFYVLNGATLTLSNVNIIGEGGWGIVGPNGVSKETLKINNSYIQLDTKRAGVCDFMKIDLGNCKIEEPSDGSIDKAGYSNNLAIVDGSGEWAKYVVISIDDAVENLNRGDAKVNKIYDVSGAEKQKLSRGLNILRMDDGTVRKVLKK